MQGQRSAGARGPPIHLNSTHTGWFHCTKTERFITIWQRIYLALSLTDATCFFLTILETKSIQLKINHTNVLSVHPRLLKAVLFQTFLKMVNFTLHKNSTQIPERAIDYLLNKDVMRKSAGYRSLH